MNKLYLPNYNFSATLLGGQSFAWEYIDEEYIGHLTNSIVILKQDGDHIFWQTYPQKDNIHLIENYFNIYESYEQKITKLKRDNHLSEVFKKLSGVRILRQDLTQTLLSFLMSSNRSIKSIRKSIEILQIKYGNKIYINGKTLNTFPNIEVLSSLSLQDWWDIRIGFRAKYLFSAIPKLLDLENSLKQEITKDYLLSYIGVGNKIADCVLTFSLGYENITPIDRWIMRIFENNYGLNPKIKYQKIVEWYQNKFWGHAAIAGQYLFEYHRKK